MNGFPLEYKTVLHAASTRLTEKKSEFISHVMPVSSEEQALAFLADIRSKYTDAKHNVYAYVVQENNLQRFSDDREPPQTAGMPVLDSMRKRGLTDVIVVVTRYFGGTLLGTGGLVRAYGRCASDGILAAEPVICRLCRLFHITVSYTLSGRLQHELTNSPHIIENISYTDEVVFCVCVKAGEEEPFTAWITDCSGGGALIEKKSTKYIHIPMKEGGHSNE